MIRQNSKGIPVAKIYYQDALTTLYLGDCLEVLKEFQDQSVDVILSDPPYGNNNNNNGDLIHNIEKAIPGRRAKDDDGTREYEGRPIANDGPEDMRRVVDGMLLEAARILKKDNSACLVFCGGGGPTPTFAWLADRMGQKGMEFFHAVVWDKGGLGMGWKYRRNYEMIMVGMRKGAKLKWEWESNGAETANVVRLNKIIPSEDQHPTPKPVELMHHFLRFHAKPGDVVLDPFSGGGTTLVACREAGIKSIGIEINEKWAELTARRLTEPCQVRFDI